VRKILIGGVVVLVIFVTVFRQRIFLRDPLGKVEKNRITQDTTRVFINYSNDVLVEDTAAQRFVLVQGWSKTPGVPKHLACVTALMCWTDGDEATVFPLGDGSSQGRAAMSAREVTFEDETGAAIRVEIR
jgi:hypothetical protein